jgi:hypothetical protein
MRNVLEFLERVGQDCQLRHAEPAVLAEALARAGIDTGLHQAILDPDSSRLQALLDLPANICCAVHPAHEDDDEDEEDEEDEDPDDDDFDADDDEDFDGDDEDDDEDDEDDSDPANGDADA